MFSAIQINLQYLTVYCSTFTWELSLSASKSDGVWTQSGRVQSTVYTEWFPTNKSETKRAIKQHQTTSSIRANNIQQLSTAGPSLCVLNHAVEFVPNFHHYLLRIACAVGRFRKAALQFQATLSVALGTLYSLDGSHKFAHGMNSLGCVDITYVSPRRAFSDPNLS